MFNFNTAAHMGRLGSPLPTLPPGRVVRKSQSTVTLKCVQFGWECRDHKFSVEWEHSCSGSAKVMYDQDRREFRIKIARSRNTYIIAIHANQVKWASAEIANDGSHAVFFSLAHPPTYETELSIPSRQPSDSNRSVNGSEALEAIIRSLSMFKFVPQAQVAPKRDRWAGVDTGHAVVSPYTSLAIRLECRGDADLDTFRHMARTARLKLTHFAYPVVRRGLFSEEVRTQYDTWVSTLPWKIAFRIESLARHLLLDLREILGLRDRIEDMIDAKGVPHVVDFLRYFATEARLWVLPDGETESPISTAEELFVRCEQEFVLRAPSLSRAGRADTFDCLHVTVTPTTFKPDGPFPEQSNRVMRRYPNNHDSFLRVSFVDETKLHFRFDREVDGPAFIKRRVGSFLLEGLQIAGHRFQFLAYSQSALKEHTVWFVKEFVTPRGKIVNAASIISGLGKFDGLIHDPMLMHCPARYGARISLAFTATESSVSVEADEVFMLEDIKDSTRKYCFTDGVGTISPELAKVVSKNLHARRGRTGPPPPYPRAIQIRFMGVKGVLSVDHTRSGREVGLRPSMIKFEAPDSLNIEIAQVFNKPGKFYLNRPLIMVLEALGVPYKSFFDLQDAAVKEVNRSTESLPLAAKLLGRHGLGTSFRLTWVMSSLDKLGLRPRSLDTFWTQMMDFAINHILRELKHHARIPVPDAWNIVGVADIHGFLQEGEIFACIAPTDGEEMTYLEGPTLISRSPTIHPGDVQVVHAIGRPPPGSPFEKESLRNCLVFSVKGARPLPTFLAGGDLDGDTYVCTMLKQLIPPLKCEPAPYTPAQRKTVDHPSTMQDVAEFVTDYFSNDNIGLISSIWLMLADRCPEGIFDADCLKLSALASEAVDYPKTGRPVDQTSIPKYRFKEKPDWSAPETINTGDPKYYESDKAIGKLFREIKLPAFQTLEWALRTQNQTLREGQQVTLQRILDAFRNGRDVDEDDFVWTAVHHRVMEFIRVRSHDEDLIAEIWEIFESYVIQFQTTCFDRALSTSKTEMLTEQEAVIGTIVAKSSQPRVRQDGISKLREHTTILVQSVADQLAGEVGTLYEKSMERAWVGYRIASMEKESFGAKSFAWIALGKVFDSIRDIEESEGVF